MGKYQPENISNLDPRGDSFKTTLIRNLETIGEVVNNISNDNVRGNAKIHHSKLDLNGAVLNITSDSITFPLNDAENLTTDCIIDIENTNTTDNGSNAICGKANGPNSFGVKATSTHATGAGVYSTNTANNGVGILSEADGTGAIALHGDADGASSISVLGQHDTGTNGTAIKGVIDSGDGSFAGYFLDNHNAGGSRGLKVTGKAEFTTQATASVSELAIFTTGGLLEKSGTALTAVGGGASIETCNWAIADTAQDPGQAIPHYSGVHVTADFTIDTLVAECDTYSSSDTLRLAVYSSSKGKLAEGSVTVTALGLWTVTLGSSVALSRTDYYYFGLIRTGASGNTFSSRNISSTNTRHTFQGAGSSTFPSTESTTNASGRSFWIKGYKA